MPETLLHLASKVGSMNRVRTFIKDGLDIEAKDDRGETPLHIASHEGHSNIVDYLMKRGADVNAKDNRGNTPLHHASMGGHVEIIDYLVDEGVDIDATSENGSTPIHRALSYLRVKAVQQLIKRGANLKLTSDVYTSIHMASIGDNVEHIRDLIKNGANVNLKHYNELTPIQQAAVFGNIEIFRELVNNGGNTDIDDEDSEEPLVTAIVFGENVEILNELIKLGGDVNRKLEGGNTPLHFASITGFAVMIKELVKNGADLEGRNDEGGTPLQLALYKSVGPVSFVTEAQRLEAIRELIKLGASTKGIEFPDIYLIHLMGMDMIMFEDKHVDDYLKEDSMNFVILDGNNPIFTNVKDLQNNMEDAIVLECRAVGHYNPSNVVHDTELFNPRKIGTASGYFDASSMRDAMGLVTRENKRLFRLSGSIKTIPAVVSQLAYEGRTGLLGANHCQAGADGDIRIVENVDVSNIPVVNAMNDESIEQEASMLSNSYLIIKNSNVNTNQAKKLREMITNAASALLEDSRMNKYKRNVDIGILDIRSMINIKYLTNLCRVFKPSIDSVEIHEPDIQDFSFIHDVSNLKRFSSTVSVNSRSLFSHLKRHTGTLETLSMPIKTTIDDMSAYTTLQKVRLYNFEHHDNVIESISGLKNIKHLDLESSDYSGDMDNLGRLQSLEKLRISLSRFDEDISEISKLNNLENLELHLPVFTGSVYSLKKLNKLKKLKLVTMSPIEMDLVTMG